MTSNVYYTNTMDLLQSQIKNSCSLALPEGLKDLMSDISREVLRARPNNIPQFIADYLEVLLEVREKLSIASHICNDACEILCEPELYNELKAIGLSDEDIDIAAHIVEEHWDQRDVKEQSILIKLAKKLSIDEMQLPAIRDVIQKAIKLHHIKDGVLSGSEDKDNAVQGAFNHTLDWYRLNKTPTEEVYMAPDFDPCGSKFSSTDPVSYINLPKHGLSAHDHLDNEKEYISIDYTSAGKVKFGNEKINSYTNTSAKEEPRTAGARNIYDDDDNHIKIEDHNDEYIADDKNVINDDAELTDDDIEENIKSDSHDDTSSSSVEELFVAV